MGRVVLSFVGLEGLDPQFVEGGASHEGKVCVSGWEKGYLTPRETELMAASLKD